MDEFLTRPLLTIAIILGCWVFALLLRRAATRLGRSEGYSTDRVARVKVVINASLFTLALLLLASVWGFKQNLVVFASSVFALVGVALFASWSMLSNTTASLMIFFTAPFRMHDRIRMLEGDNSVTGKVRHLGLIYVTLEDEEGHQYLIPNNILLQRTVIRLAPGKDIPCDQKHCR